MQISENLDKAKVAVPVKLTAAFPVESDSLARTYRGTAFKDFIDLLPYANVQRIAVDAAKKWIQHMTLQGYELIGNETEIQLWGPYRPKSTGGTATSFQMNEDPFPDGKAKMLMTGTFLARRHRTVE